MSSITHAERIALSDHVYGCGTPKKVSNPEGYKILKSKELDSGLEIYAIQKVGTNEIIFTTRGSDDDLDWGFSGPNASHFFGKMHPQDAEAIWFVNQFLSDAYKDGIDYKYSVAGDSKGGAIAQIIAWTWGFGGTTTEAAAGGGVVKDPAYLELVKELPTLDGRPVGITPGQLVNVLEKGSVVSWLAALWPGVDHIGMTVSLDTVGADFSTTLYDLFVGQHTNRDNRIGLCDDFFLPYGADPFVALLDKTIDQYADQVQLLRVKLEEKTEQHLLLDGDNGEILRLETELAKHESNMLDLVEARDTIIIQYFAGKWTADAHWLADALGEEYLISGNESAATTTDEATYPLQLFYIPGHSCPK